jgi:hypothetical protein
MQLLRNGPKGRNRSGESNIVTIPTFILSFFSITVLSSYCRSQNQARNKRFFCVPNTVHSAKKITEKSSHPKALKSSHTTSHGQNFFFVKEILSTNGIKSFHFDNCVQGSILTSTIPCCTVLRCTVLRFAGLGSAVLCCAVLCFRLCYPYFSFPPFYILSEVLFSISSFCHILLLSAILP